MKSNIYSDSIQLSVRKRLMYVTQEDFYFLTYCLLLILKQLNCVKEVNQFKDIRKLAFCVDLISDNNLISILLNYKEKTITPLAAEKEQLSNAYIKGQNRLPFLNRLIFSLEKRKFITIVTEPSSKILGVYLNILEIPDTFFDEELFEGEIVHISLLKKVSTKIRTTSLSAFLEAIFVKNGVHTWLD